MIRLPVEKLGKHTSLISSGSTPLGGSQVYLTNGPVLFIRSQNVLMNQLDLESAVYISDEMDRKIGRTRLQADDVLLNITGASIGRVATFDGQSKRANVNQHVCVIRPDPRVLSARYLSRLIATPAFQRRIQQAQVGGTRQALTFSQIADFEVPLPPQAEQRRIAEVLDRAEALRTKRRSTLAQLGTLTQSIFLELFGDPIVNQRGWPLKKFGAVGTLDRGVSKHRPRNAPELLGGSHPLVQTGEVANCDGYIRGYTSTYSDLGLRQSKLWPAGTLCITIAANIAKTGILTFGACFPDSVVGFRAEDPATIEFVRTWLSFLQKALEDGAPESAQKNINLAILRDLDVPIPPLDLQREFAHRVTAVEKLKAAHRASLAALDALFDVLQSRAFRGEL